jgi:hypothetical protein
MAIISDAPSVGNNRLYQPSPVKRTRRTSAEIETINQAIIRIVQADNPMTLRGLFYRLVSEGMIGKAENEYQNVGRYLLQLRRCGRVPYRFIADNTRWMRKQSSYDNLEDALANTAAAYRRSLWNEQDAHVEVWCEKDTLAGVLILETNPYDVPLMVVRGFSSETYVYESAQAMRHVGKPIYLYLLTDLDPSGVHIALDIERKIRGFIPDSDVTVRRIAVTPEQVQQWKLPTRPTKKTDSRSKTFAGESVELDAIPPTTLRTLVREAIEQHIDSAQLVATKRTERLERASLYDILDMIGGAE